MKPVRIEEEAERELIGAVDFYESTRTGLGLEFEVAAREAVRAMQRDGERHPLRRDGTRRAVMKRFPFVIHYLDCLTVFGSSRSRTRIEDRDTGNRRWRGVADFWSNHL